MMENTRGGRAHGPEAFRVGRTEAKRSDEEGYAGGKDPGLMDGWLIRRGAMIMMGRMRRGKGVDSGQQWV
jgi:hypothetical protein